MGLAYQCWFCGQSIDRIDPNALLISVGGLWRYDTGRTGKDDPFQNLYAHSKCAVDRLKGFNMEIDPEVFGDEE